MKKIKVCPICGTKMKIDTSAVCTSIPPMYRCVCPSCNCLDFIKTSEYDQYKEEPSLPSDLDEAAHSYSESDEPLYSPGHRFHWDNESLFGKQIETTFKAGAEWMAGQGWISVDEKLPKMDEEVIVLTDEFGTAPIYKIAFGHIVDVERCIDYNGWNIPGVKYWMPCPKIPNE